MKVDGHLHQSMNKSIEICDDVAVKIVDNFYWKFTTSLF